MIFSPTNASASMLKIYFNMLYVPLSQTRGVDKSFFFFLFFHIGKSIPYFFTDESYYFTAGHKITGDGMEYWKWHGTLYGAAFTKWFPGKETLLSIHTMY